jgi:hypothetical protein
VLLCWCSTTAAAPLPPTQNSCAVSPAAYLQAGECCHDCDEVSRAQAGQLGPQGQQQVLTP